MKDFQLTDLEGIGPVTLNKLEKAGIKSPLDIIVRGVKEFSRVSGLTTDASKKHMIKMLELLKEDNKGLEVDDIDMLEEVEERQIHLALDIEELDEMLDGGFETGSMYEVWGEEGCGKTQLSMTAAVQTLKQGHGVMFIDCEGTFKIKRFKEICENRDVEYNKEKIGYHRYLDDFLLIEGIQNIMAELIEKDVKLLVVDGLVGVMRLGYKGRGELGERQQELEDVLKYLRNMSALLNMSTIITNQVTANPDPFGARIKPIGGHVLGHYVKYIIGISKGLKNNRTARLRKSPSQPEGEYKWFVNEEGASQYESVSKKKKTKKMDDIVEDTQGLIDKSLLDDEPVEKVKVY